MVCKVTAELSPKIIFFFLIVWPILWSQESFCPHSKTSPCYKRNSATLGAILNYRHDPVKTRQMLRGSWSVQDSKGTCWIIVTQRFEYSWPGSTSQWWNTTEISWQCLNVFGWYIFPELILWIELPSLGKFILTYRGSRFSNKKGNQVWRTWGFPLLVRGTCGVLGEVQSSYWTPGCLTFVPSVWVFGNLFPWLEIFPYDLGTEWLRFLVY